MATPQTKKNLSATLIGKIISFDFDKYYTAKVRILCHIIFWLVFTVFTCFFLYTNGGRNVHQNLPLFVYNGLVYVLVNIFIFYSFFYLIVPRTLLKNRIFLFVISVYFLAVLFVIFLHLGDIYMINHFNIDRKYFGEYPPKTGIEFWGVILLVALLMIVIFLPWYSPAFLVKILFDMIRTNSKMLKAERKANQLVIEKMEMETNFLRAQLNPHFLFNTLNSLYGLSLRKDNKTPVSIVHFSDILSYMLYDSSTETILLSKELAFIKDYVTLEKMRFSKNKRIILDIDESNIGEQKIAPLLTFPFIENAFKYGLKSSENSFLEIKISVTDNIFYFYIINDKDIEAAADKDKKSGGIGIENVRKRLELLYPNKHQLYIKNSAISFSVSMQIEME